MDLSRSHSVPPHSEGKAAEIFRGKYHYLKALHSLMYYFFFSSPSSKVLSEWGSKEGFIYFAQNSRLAKDEKWPGSGGKQWSQLLLQAYFFHTLRFYFLARPRFSLKSLCHPYALKILCSLVGQQTQICWHRTWHSLDWVPEVPHWCWIDALSGSRRW